MLREGTSRDAELGRRKERKFRVCDLGNAPRDAHAEFGVICRWLTGQNLGLIRRYDPRTHELFSLTRRK
jgi:hypothetical protein